VTHGFFSYQQGSGVGLGFVSAQLFVQQLQVQTEVLGEKDDSSPSSPSVWVWCRNQNSLSYRAGQIQLMTDRP
jgi:hypothetical protein